MTWRHTHWREGEFYPECIAADGDLGCGCTTPTPDPASPCREALCGVPEDASVHVEDEQGHQHQPTRCAQCHHPIEAPR